MRCALASAACLVDVEHRYAAAGARQALRGRGPQPGGAAGDDRSLSVETHCGFPREMARRSLSRTATKRQTEQNAVFNRIAIAILLVLCMTGAQAQDKTVQLKLSSWVPPAHPLNPALQAWGEDIDKASGGTIKSTLFPSEQLGKAMDHYDMARDGIADFAYVNPGYQPGRFPIIAAGELPFLIGNAKGGSAALDAWYRKYAAAEMKDVHFCFAFVLDPRHVPFTDEEDRRAGGSAWHEGPPGECHDGGVRHAAGRHQCAGLGARGARGAGTRRGRCDHLPLAVDHPVRHRQGDEVPHGHAVLDGDLRVGDEQGEV